MIIAIYLIFIVAVCLRIVFETRNTTKTIAYLLLCIFLPIAGTVIYFIFGVNFWKKKRFDKKSVEDKKMLDSLEREWDIPQFGDLLQKRPSLQNNMGLASMVASELHSQVTGGNQLKILVNGEEKFPEVLAAMKAARHHIHLEYYIFENDTIGAEIENVLVTKALEGVQVRFIYDDFGSPDINKKMERRLRAAGVEIYPFQKILFYLLANRLNYRNHRKIIVIDGQTAFTGGMNVADRYVNDDPKNQYWRDIHLRIDGPGVFYLQYLFFSDWNFCSGKTMIASKEHFASTRKFEDDALVQVVAGGPDAYQPTILFSMLKAINLAQKEILITTPYFIPGEPIIDALKIAALAGLSVKLLVPGISDSVLVNAAAKSNYGELLDAGVDIYLYQKGFIHSKTLVADGHLAIIGSANMDLRSFELNFEVNVILYDEHSSEKLRQIFFEDLQSAEKIDPDQWSRRPFYTQLPEKLARLFSPVM